jgi:hypothetical protein
VARIVDIADCDEGANITNVPSGSYMALWKSKTFLHMDFMIGQSMWNSVTNVYPATTAVSHAIEARSFDILTLQPLSTLPSLGDLLYGRNVPPPTSPNNMAWCFMCPNDIGLRFGSEGQAAAARVQKLPKAFIEYMTVDSNFLSPAKILKELQNERVSLRSLTDGSLTGTNGTSLVAPSCPMSRK